MESVRTRIREKLQELLRCKGGDPTFDDREELIRGGRLQSIDVLDVALFLEQEFGVDFSTGFDLSRLESVDEICALLQERAGEGR